MFKVQDLGQFYRITVQNDTMSAVILVKDENELRQILVNENLTSNGDFEAMLKDFEMRGHNYAEFGRFGGYVFSRFEGMVH